MTADDTAFREAVDYLARYGGDDWMMLSVVVSEAHDLLRPSATKSEVVDATMALAHSLIELHIVPGDLVADDRNFVAWHGPPDAQLERLRTELTAMVQHDELPMGAEVCWFHKIEP